MGRQWWEVTIKGDPSLEDPLFWRLQSLGSHGTACQIQGQQLFLTAYFYEEQIQLQELERLTARLRQDAATVSEGEVEIYWQLVPEEDWAQSWQQYWQSQEVGDRLLIHPHWLPDPMTDRILLRLNPGVAFGTGAHPTTQLCLEALERQLTPAQAQGQMRAIADIGCGSGILSIAALLLGAEQAYAVDIDPLAVNAARDSRDLNGIPADALKIKLGSLEELSTLLDHPVDGFVCNILASVILTLIPRLSDLIQPHGWGLLSGILCSQIPIIEQALGEYGWHTISTHTQADWCCLHIGRVV